MGPRRPTKRVWLITSNRRSPSVAIVFSLSRSECVFTSNPCSLYGSSPNEFGRIIAGLSVREPIVFGGHWYYSSSRLACTAAIFAHLFTKGFSHEKSGSMGPAALFSEHIFFFFSSSLHKLYAHDFMRLCPPSSFEPSTVIAQYVAMSKVFYTASSTIIDEYTSYKLG